MIVTVNVFDLVIMAILLFCFAVFAVAFIVSQIVSAIHKRQQKKIDEAYKGEDGER